MRLEVDSVNLNRWRVSRDNTDIAALQIGDSGADWQLYLRQYERLGGGWLVFARRRQMDFQAVEVQAIKIELPAE